MLERLIHDSALQKPKLSRHWLLVLAVCSLCGRVSAGQPNDIILSSEHWSVRISPGTLETSAELPGDGKILLSAGQPDLGPVSDMVQEGPRAQWLLKTKGVRVEVRLDKRDLSVRFSSDKTGVFTWPVFQERANVKALIWPRWEGCYIPLDDRRWENYLIETGTCDTLEGLSMPFWGLDCGDFSLTYIITNPYNNEIQFQRASDGLSFLFTHEFTSLTPTKEFGFLIHLGENNSPIEPAKQFRKWLFEQGKFVGMEKKVKKVPNAARLLGAAHVYLWGDAPFSRHDIPGAKWRPFCRNVVEQSRAAGTSPGKRIQQLMTPDRWSEVVEIAAAQWPSQYLKGQVANELSRLLAMK
ncbi:MAG: hypothetical protein ABIF19_17345, partial [Planctomycetota bacterium]